MFGGRVGKYFGIVNAEVCVTLEFNRSATGNTISL